MLRNPCCSALKNFAPRLPRASATQATLSCLSLGQPFAGYRVEVLVATAPLRVILVLGSGSCWFAWINACMWVSWNADADDYDDGDDGDGDEVK